MARGDIEKWIRRAVAAHLFASVFAWCALFAVAVTMHPGQVLRSLPSWILFRGILSPILMPLWLIVSALGRADPAWLGGLLWAAYLGMFGFIMIGWARIEARRRLLRERARLGLCPRCGYDLRGSPERCPECGRDRVQS
jgi:hypothetical protein